MPNDIKRKKTVGAMVSAIVLIALLGTILGALLLSLLRKYVAQSMVVLLFCIYALGIVAVIVGILLALRQRLKEIEGGEEDAAAEY